MNKLTGFIFVLLFLSSCDTGWSSKGVVIDKLTGQPIENAKINIKGLGSTSNMSISTWIKLNETMHGLKWINWTLLQKNFV